MYCWLGGLCGWTTGWQRIATAIIVLSIHLLHHGHILKCAALIRSNQIRIAKSKEEVATILVSSVTEIRYAVYPLVIDQVHPNEAGSLKIAEELSRS